MKKYFAMMVAVLFLFGIVGTGFAQGTSAEVPKAKDTSPEKKTEKQKKRQQVTTEKEKAAAAPAVAEGQAKPDTTKAKKSEKQKKRQAETDAKKKAKDEAAEKGASGK